MGPRLQEYGFQSHQVYWFFSVCIVLAGKLSFYVLDPTPMFFMSDSMDFVRTALSGEVIPLRSFVYSYLLRFLAISQHSLAPLIILQVFLSAFSAIILIYILVRFFAVSHGIALGMGLLCTIDPLQLLYERYVMAETTSLFIFVCYMGLIFFDFDKKYVLGLVIVQFVGCILISFRLSYLPIVQLNAVLLPCIGSILHLRSSGAIRMGPWRKRWMTVLVVIAHFIVSICSFQLFHTGFKQLTGRLANMAPAYSNVSGFLPLVYWAPLVTVEDFPRQDLGRIILDKTIYPLDERNAQWILEGGMIPNLRSLIGDQQEAERFAKETALNILRRDPIGVAKLYLKTYRNYWYASYLKLLLQVDRGERPLPEIFLGMLKKNFNLDAVAFPYMATLTNRYFYMAWPWYLMLLCTPFLSFVALGAKGVEQFMGRVVIFIITGLLIVGACHMNVVRYLQPLGWVFFLTVGQLLDGKLRVRKLEVNWSEFERQPVG